MLARLSAWARGFLRRRAIDAELEEELQFHLEHETQMHVERGVSPVEARRLAALSLGGVIQTRDAVRDVRITWIEAAWRETRQGIRTLWATPAYSVPAAVVLALGIGGTTAVFSVLNSVLLRPLPYPDASELVRVWSRNDERRIPFLSVSPADFEDWRARASAPRQLGAYERARVLQLRDSGEPVTVMSVTPDLFPTLGITPAIGRGFRSDESSDTAAMISHDLWQRRFGGAPDAIGRSLPIGDNAWTVAGVMPPRFEVPIAPADVWVPLDTRITTQARFAHTLRVVARAAPGADAAATAARDLEAVAAQLAVERPGENRGWSVTVLPLFDVVVSPEFRRSLWIVAGAVLFVLLMASTSAAALLLTRASGRQSELAVRVALGASRGSLVRLLLLESLVLGVVSGLAGLLLAYCGVVLLQTVGAATVPRLDEVSLSGRVFAFAAAATLLSALAAGLLPAWRSTRSLHERLRSRGDVSEPASARTLHGLVVVEVTSAVLLVVGAALLIQTVLNLQRRELGFDPTDLVVIDTIWPSPGQSSDLVVRTEDALSRVAALAGVRRVAAVSAPPFSGSNSGNTFQIEGQNAAGAPAPDADYRVVSPGYFETLAIPLRGGRAFTAADGGARGTVIISETAARRFWPEGDAIGRRLKVGRSDWLTIVGIVSDARYLALDDPSESVRPMLYLPHRQMPSTTMTVVLRSSVAPESLIASVRRTLNSEAGVGITRIETMQGMLREASASQRFTMNLVTAFAATAVALAVVGLYGLLGFLIARRTREIGVRVALGAKHWQVVRTVAGRTLALVGVGVAAGLAASFALTDALRSALFAVSPHDPFTYLSVAVGFLALAIAAGTLPTLRALRIDPVRVIRAEY
jgi:putative ABC transport system permease protein